MLNERDLRTYKRYRNDNTNPLINAAHIALARVKADRLARECELNHDGAEYVTDDGFTVRLNVECDYLSLDDVFGDTYGELDDKIETSLYRDGPDGARLDDSVIYRPNRHWTFEERRGYFSRKGGMSRNVAYLAALRDLHSEGDEYRRIVDGNDGQCATLVVTVLRDDDEYGSDALGGVWITDTYTVAHAVCDSDLVATALDGARKQWRDEIDAAARGMEMSRPDMYPHAAAPYA